MAKHGLHALELRVCSQLYLTAKPGRKLAWPLVSFRKQIGFLEFLALVGLAIWETFLDYYRKYTYFKRVFRLFF